MGSMVRHRFRVEEVEALGALHPELRLELLDGEVYEMAPPSSEHAGLLDWLLFVLGPRVAGLAQLRVQSPLRLSEESLLLPDLLLLKPREDFYTQAHPGPEDVLLLVEVSLSTEAWDREKKLSLYARAGLPEVWLLTREGLEVHREPREDRFHRRFRIAKGEKIAPLLLPQAAFLFQPPL